MRRIMIVAMGNFGLTACSAPGLLYTDVTRPLTLDMQETMLTATFAVGTQNIFREPITRAGLTAEWTSGAPGQAARAGGLEAVHYADVRRQSLLGGLWGRTTIVLYGNPLPERSAALPSEESARKATAEQVAGAVQ
jgi:hypothetical protein